jgi:hypothetical protein
MKLMDNTSFTIQSGSVRLAGIAVNPEDGIPVSMDYDPVKLSKFTDAPVEPMGRITVTTQTSGGKAVSAVVLSTELHARQSRSAQFTFLELEGTDVLINWSDTTVDNGVIGTDGLCAALTEKGAFLLAEGTYGSVNGKTIVRSEKPVSILIEKDTVRYSACETTTIQILPEDAVRTVLLNDKKIKEWKKEKDTVIVTVQLPAGQGLIEFKK